MHLIDPKGHSRRLFLKRSGALAMAGTALPFALNLSAMSEAAAQTAIGSHRRVPQPIARSPARAHVFDR